MALNELDRRRILLASALTLVALPALWWANQSDDAAPNVATAGISVGAQPAARPADAEASDAAPVFLDGPSGQVGAGLAEIAVPAPPAIARITTTATFRNDLGSSATCALPGVGNGARITVVNLDNNRSITCTSVLAPSGARDQLVMPAELFSQIADLTDAPIPVEIRQ